MSLSHSAHLCSSTRYSLHLCYLIPSVTRSCDVPRPFCSPPLSVLLHPMLLVLIRLSKG
jgi:hypothetical protein